MKVGDVKRKRRFLHDRRCWFSAYRTWRQARQMWGSPVVSYDKFLQQFRMTRL